MKIVGCGYFLICKINVLSAANLKIDITPSSSQGNNTASTMVHLQHCFTIQTTQTLSTMVE